MKRINLKYGEVRVSDECPQNIIDMLENISELAFNDHLEKKDYFFFSDGKFVNDRSKVFYPIIYQCRTYSDEKAIEMYMNKVNLKIG